MGAPDDSASFLMYHELRMPGRPIVDEAPGYARYVVEIGAFQQQLARISSAGWSGVSVADWQRMPAARQTVITFDDGAETDLIAAVPALGELGFGATFYLTVGFLDKRGYLSRAQARELASSGFEVGCHSMTHAFLDDLDETALRREIVDAKHALEDICGRPVASFSCPGGRTTPRMTDMAADAGYTSLATSEVKRNRHRDAPWALGRIAVLNSTTSDAVLEYVKGNGIARQRLRHAILGAGKRILGNAAYDMLRGRLLDRSAPPASK